jgi:very-short-patch-repair endonuclease
LTSADQATHDERVPFKRDHNPRLLKFAREMRREPTDAERKLWHLLRDGRLGGFKFRRQCPVAGYILDFYCLSAGLVVEADGGQHTEPEAHAYDEARTQRLSDRGIRVLRFPDDEVLKYPDAVREAIYAALTSDAPPP